MLNREHSARANIGAGPIPEREPERTRQCAGDLIHELGRREAVDPGTCDDRRTKFTRARVLGYRVVVALNV